MVETSGNSFGDLLESQMRTILDTAMDGIISIDENQAIVLFNGAAEAIFGWRADQVLGRSIETLIPPRFAGKHREDVERFGRGDIPSRRMGTQRMVMALRASGEEFPIEASISHTLFDQRRIYTVILRDVTEAVRYRKQIEQQLQMLEQVSDAVSVVDLNGRITYWNKGAHRLFGWSAKEVLDHESSTLFGPTDPRLMEEIIHETNTHRSWSGELSKTTRSGKTIIVEHRRTLLTDEAEGISGYLCIDIDITNRKKFERLSNRRQRLESIGTLAGGIAHDLNNVLTPILMGAKLLSSNRVPGDRQGLLNTMVASAQRGAALIQQLLSFAGGVRGERGWVHIDHLISETRGLLEHTFPKTISIETSIAKDCPMVLGDATELSQILMNLCINARDAMPDGGKLTIEARSMVLNGNSSQLHPDARPGRYLLMKVTDTGCGMSSEVLDRIFDPFFTTKDIGQGTGLGLATVMGIVKSHGGFTNVYSEPGRGSAFFVYLPAAQAVESSQSDASDAIAESGRGQLLLLVDDESMILQMTSAVLETAGFRVMTAQNGADAIAKFKDHQDEVCAVILDIMMPGMDGLQTLDELKRINPRVKAIACSGLRTSQREAEVLARGAKAFLAKPYSDDQLLHLISRIASVDE